MIGDYSILKIKKALRKIVYKIPGAQQLWIFCFKYFHTSPHPDFKGWGMVTSTMTPWFNGGNNDLARSFLEVHNEIIAKVVVGEIKLSQFDEIKDKKKLLEELMWRHYIVYWSAQFAANAGNNCEEKNLVECGVCDGLTSYFAIRAVKLNFKYKSYLYDAWEGMKKEFLLDSELEYQDQYSFLAMDNAQRNLATFKDDTIFIKGFIPDSFSQSENPKKISWLHLDLNSSIPTLAALEFFWERICPGGVILLDDYGWHSCLDTRMVVDEFFVDKLGILLPLPTGQAIFFKTKI